MLRWSQRSFGRLQGVIVVYCKDHWQVEIFKKWGSLIDGTRVALPVFICPANSRQIEVFFVRRIYRQLELILSLFGRRAGDQSCSKVYYKHSYFYNSSITAFVFTY